MHSLISSKEVQNAKLVVETSRTMVLEFSSSQFFRVNLPSNISFGLLS